MWLKQEEPSKDSMALKKDLRPNDSFFVDLLKFLSTVRGDFANITAPAFFLAPSSVVEVPQCWSQRPKVFAAPALEPDPKKRSLLVLKIFLTGLRSQLYIAGAPGVSIKKPLNAFLGEIFSASWTDDGCTTRLITEQVSHHPPITAVHVSDKENGVRADGYARVEMTFNGSVNVRHIGHTLIRVERFGEDYLLPLPDVQVRGFLSACLYPEITGTYRIYSSNGYVSEITFAGSGLLRGQKNRFDACLFHSSDPKTRFYQVSGVWSEGWVIKDGQTGQVLDTYQVDAPENEPAARQVPPVEEQDPWESRRAWADVINNLERGNLRAAATAKNVLEESQRQMRKQERSRDGTWKPLLFESQPGSDHHVFHELTRGTDWDLWEGQTHGVWRIKDDVLDTMQRPYRGDTSPFQGR